MLRVLACSILLTACSTSVTGTGSEPASTGTPPAGTESPPTTTEAEGTLPELSSEATIGTAAGPNVTGKWQGDTGKDSVFLDLLQVGDMVTGVFCEAPHKDCSVIRNGMLVGRQFTGLLSFPEAGHEETASWSLTLSADGNRLVGTAHSSKCQCDLALSLVKQ